LQQLFKSKDLTPSDRSKCEVVLALIESDSGNTTSAILHLQQSISSASEAKDLERVCWAQLHLLRILSDRSGIDATPPLLAELRANAIKLGDPQVVAALHIYVGQMEAKQGLLRSAQQHTILGLRILHSAPNLGLEAMAENTLLSIALMRSQFDIALRHARCGADIARESGAAVWRRAFHGNLAHLFYVLGRFDEATAEYQQSQSLLPSEGDNRLAWLGGLGEICLAEGRLDECQHLVNRLEESIRQPTKAYNYRHTLPMRSLLSARFGQFDRAFEMIELASALADEAGDQLLAWEALLTRAGLLQQVRRLPELMTTLDGMLTEFGSYPDLHAQYERIVGCALASINNLDAGIAHIERSRRIYESVRNAPGLIELSRCWSLTTSAAPQGDDIVNHEVTPDSDARGAVIATRTGLQNASALMLHSSRPRFLAREIVHILAATDCVVGAVAISRAHDGEVETFANHGAVLPADSQQASQRLTVGAEGEHTIEILFDSKSDIESMATINAVSVLLTTTHDLERARAEREERLTLWPIEDVQTDDGRAVVSGHMRELMTFARRIATANVSVLITGESGTGKEILARAIHGFSARAQKPFIPFNCTAIPREMLESQLFGHRRGSFTGADRDHPGLIRSARDGTLFLDEIGELGLDLQPKLLRFLESGEICPLGDATPFTVDVRIIAATNSQLERAVKDGRFREDLFYRLNVIRLRIAPLRERRDEIPGLVHYFVQRAAEEFHKGSVRVAEETMEYLLLYGWPGNIRQLHNELRRMVALADRDAVLTPAQLSDELLRAKPAPERRVNGREISVPLHDKLQPTLARIESEMVRAALREHKGKVDAAAKALGISRKGLYLKRQRLGL
jgi:transcriptional regulator with PAS, ATPase and Fis domain/tetratricopeptide (TPR) repeat protein